ncbi:MAG: redoxin domain-containing protein [Clostridiales bacterium]|nr:redoxin domain-containing protein [Clostridiales bacterium]
MNLAIETSIPAATVFIQGLISFFSPCVLPLIPLYIGYLSGGAKTADADGNIRYKQSKVMLNTLFFVFGISFSFFLLGLGFTAIGRFFQNYQTWITRIGGILIALFGLSQLGIFGSSGMGKEHHFRFQPDSLAMNPLTALVFGFTFSFAWTPCVGPALASVLIMAASSASSTTGFVLIGVYTLGFVLPFMGVGIFTGTLLDFFKKHRQVVKYTTKAGGVLMILIGIMMFTGWMNGFSSYLSGTANSSPQNSISAPATDAAAEDSNNNDSNVNNNDTDVNNSSADSADVDSVAAPEFTLTDQYGNTHTLSDYKGKTVFLNFWATWCPPCRAEMPEIQEIYGEYGENAGDVIVLGIASPDVGREGSAEDIAAFLEENNYTYPVAMDTGGEMASAYGINAYPTTFMIDKDGNVFGYVSGQLTKDIMKSIIEQTISGVRTQ